MKPNESLEKIRITPQEYEVMVKSRRELDLRTLMLLSALESWAYSLNSKLPEFMHVEIAAVCAELKREVLK